MKKGFIDLGAMIALLISTSAKADCLDEAKNFAVGLCGELERSGIKITASGRAEANAELSSVIKSFIDVSGKGSGSGTVDKYEGLAREELAKDRFDTKTCRQNMAAKAMDVQCQKKINYETCTRPEFGFDHWGSEHTGEGSSGWRGGGHTQNEWCGELGARLLAEHGAGPVHDTVILSRDEDRKKEWGKASYNYKCTVKILWNPIYKTKTDPLCGIARSN
ncbi:hypothetical protein WOA01_23980 [Methylocystis sp. IM2]|uniref:hypothetical protein n=1 Tax=Methylocystis sp. IM2 TaxID=3136563 RepID=UPI0030FA9DCF